ncbi:MAG: 30S ribosomal protein S13 [Candidatus Aenigmarchaeota archaeon]|nr:30S ribosomal protein S13 [Candidatus Aenigmarchaeota archaeon]
MAEIDKNEAKDQKHKKIEKKDTRSYLRIANTDINSALRVRYALKGIKGIGYSFSSALCAKTGIDPNKRISDLTPDEIKAVESFLQNPQLPGWMLNRRKSIETGADMHFYGDRLKLQKMNDINFLKSIRAYRGVRHELGLPVRGQRTRSGGGGRTVGVVKKAAQPAAKPAEAKPAPKPADKK